MTVRIDIATISPDILHLSRQVKALIESAAARKSS
jgi:hypothetical protein